MRFRLIRIGTVLSLAVVVAATGPAPSQAAVSDSNGGIVHWGDRDSSPVGMGSVVSSAMDGKAIAAVEAGGEFTCALGKAGAAYCWGLGQEGSLGNGAEGVRLQPVAVRRDGAVGGGTFSELDAGMRHMCGISAGKAYCWGIGGFGRLGNGRNVGNVLEPEPVVRSGVLKGKRIVDIAAGNAHSCALDDQGHAYCWGYNDDGQLGDGSRTDRKKPVAVDRSGALKGVRLVEIDTGTSHTCAADAQGRAYCWGRNDDGELGIGSQDVRRVRPTRVDTSGALKGTQVERLALGWDHSCAVDADGRAYCWGLGQRGRLGTGETRTRRVPVAVDRSGALKGVRLRSIDAVYNHTCASSGAATYCWGGNADGQVSGSAPSAVLSPLKVKNGQSSAGGLTSATGGASHSCAVDADSRVVCWGEGASGRLGTGTTADEPAPATVTTLSAILDAVFIDVAAGETHACGTGAGAVYCWGSNTQGQLGGGVEGAAQSVPVRAGLGGDGLLGDVLVEEVSAGATFSCATGQGDDVFCWGKGGSGQLGDGAGTSSIDAVKVDDTGVLSGADIIAIDSGADHTCAVSSSGSMYCWGRGDAGQLGDGSGTSSVTPVAVDLSGLAVGEGFTAVSAGGDTTCGVTDDGRAFCWGAGGAGQLGNGSGTDATTPQLVDMSGVLSGQSVSGVAVGSSHACVVTVDGPAACFGAGGGGQLGDGLEQSSSIPVAVSQAGVLSGTTVSDVTVGEAFTCAVTTEYRAYCWGKNRYGQLGDGTTSDAAVPVAVESSGVLDGLQVLDLEASAEGLWTTVLHP